MPLLVVSPTAGQRAPWDDRCDWTRYDLFVALMRRYDGVWGGCCDFVGPSDGTEWVSGGHYGGLKGIVTADNCLGSFSSRSSLDGVTLRDCPSRFVAIILVCIILSLLFTVIPFCPRVG